MNEPQPSPPPSPFESNRPLETSGPGQAPPRRGFGKPILIGCGVILALLLIGLVVLFMNYNSFVAWTFDLMEAQMTPRLPEDLTEDERRRWTDGFEAVDQALEAKKYDVAELQEQMTIIQEEFQKVASSPTEDLERASVQRIIRALEAIAGTESPDFPQLPEAEPEPAAPVDGAEPDGAPEDGAADEETGDDETPAGDGAVGDGAAPAPTVPAVAA